MAILDLDRPVFSVVIPRGFDIRGDGVWVQLLRFALVGSLSNIAYVLLFLGLHHQGTQLANVSGSIVSTALANELHRRLTFNAAERVSWFAAQWEGGGLALGGLTLTALALASISHLFPGVSGIAQAISVIGVSAVVGGIRFLALRGWVY